MFQYEVKLAPNIGSRPLRFKILNQHLNVLGNVKTFDLPTKLANDVTFNQYYSIT